MTFKRIIVAIIVGVCALLAWGIWFEFAHPCLRYGESHTELMPGCIYSNNQCITYFYPVQTRDCLERD